MLSLQDAHICPASGAADEHLTTVDVKTTSQETTPRSGRTENHSGELDKLTAILVAVVVCALVLAAALTVVAVIVVR